MRAKYYYAVLWLSLTRPSTREICILPKWHCTHDTYVFTLTFIPLMRPWNVVYLRCLQLGKLYMACKFLIIIVSEVISYMRQTSINISSYIIMTVPLVFDFGLCLLVSWGV